VTAEEKRNGREKKTAYHRREPSKLPWLGSIAPGEQKVEQEEIAEVVASAA
jgi:hypothetical protein